MESKIETLNLYGVGESYKKFPELQIYKDKIQIVLA